MRHVGHAATRSRGTVGGSVAHSDPKAELPVALAALDARFHLRSRGGTRILAAASCSPGRSPPRCAEDELLTEIEVPAPPPGARMAFVEHARTHGDFAVAGVAVVLAPGAPAAIALLGADAVPVRAAAAEAALDDGASAREAAQVASGAVADGYRRTLIATLTERALARAMA